MPDGSGSKRSDKARREFLSEAEDVVESLRDGLARLEDQRAEREEVDPDLVNEMFRAAHSLKGLAGMFGEDAIGALAHRLEDLLDGLRLGRVALDDAVVGVLREALVEFNTALAAIGSAPGEEAPSASTEELGARLDALAQGGGATGEGDLDQLRIDPTLLRALTEYEEHRLRENMRRGRTILLVEATFEILSFDEGLSELGRAVREVAELISTLPSPGEAPESQIRFALLVATDIDAVALRRRFDSPFVQVTEVLSAGTAPDGTVAPVSTEAPAADPPADHPGPASDRTGAGPRTTAPGPVEAASGHEAAELESLRSISDTVRVDIRKLDHLMNLVGELVIQRGAIASVAQELASEPPTARIGAELRKIHQSLDRKLKDLQSGVLEVRMVPLRQVFEKLSRVVRRLRRDLDKEVRLELRGADTELDKLIVEQLVDPLMHVVRNAFDHAIESSEERTAADKEVEGCIRIEAFQRGNHVVIQVSDDGRGIDRERLLAKARSSGIVGNDETPARREILDLVFHPGLSTREAVSETSGRGVGMDVVKTNLTAFGGVVDIESTEGKGTTVTMTLPITLAILQALVVGAADQSYAIPLTSVLETLVIDPGEIQRSDRRELLNLRGEALTVLRLGREFGLAETDETPAQVFVVVLGIGDARVGLLVDRLEGQQDAVIKPIQGPVSDIHGIAGATELGDQAAVLVLDVTAFIEDAGRRREAA